MSYSEKDGQVILTMSREDYDKLLMLVGLGTGIVRRNSGMSAAHSKLLDHCTAFMNRLNQGNPHYTPYQVEAKS
jgi:hypothetical protein